MRLHSSLKTAGTLPVTLADFKTFVRQYATHEDSMLTGLLKTAVTRAEEYLGVSLAKQTRQVIYNGLAYDLLQPPRDLLLDRGPVVSITSVKYYDTSGAQQTVDPSYYELQEDRLRPVLGQFWPTVDPTHLNAFTVEYVAGTGDYTVSPKVELADVYRTGIFLIGQALYEKRPELEEAAFNTMSTFRKGQGV